MENTRKCIHCSQRLKVRPRGLCRPCYEDISIREMYPVKETYYGNDLDSTKQSLFPRLPTDTLPRTEERLKVMEERMKRGESLVHPQDAVIDGQIGNDPIFLKSSSVQKKPRRKERCISKFETRGSRL